MNDKESWIHALPRAQQAGRQTTRSWIWQAFAHRHEVGRGLHPRSKEVNPGN